MILVAVNENDCGDFSIEFRLKTIEFGDVTTKKVGDF
jgi:hypothetical protein